MSHGELTQTLAEGTGAELVSGSGLGAGNCSVHLVWFEDPDPWLQACKYSCKKQQVQFLRSKLALN